MKINFYLAEILLIIISYYSTHTTAKCPTDEVVLPCSCVNNAITCGGHEYYNLKNIFISISSALNDSEKHFRSFALTNTAIHELVIDIFYDITFEVIYIDRAYNLTQINTYAFISTSGYVTRFHLAHTPYGNNITDNNNIFNALNAMINVDSITITNTSLTTIPSHSFTVLNKLNHLFIDHNRNLKSILDYAFYDLNNLSELLFDSNPIEHISDHVFSLRNNSRGSYLGLHLYNMPNFTSNSLSRGALTAIKRPFVLNLNGDHEFKYLDEKIFKDVIDSGNLIRILLYDSILECDCRMYWLYNNELYHDIVGYGICTDGKTLFEDRPAYNNCTSN